MKFIQLTWFHFKRIIFQNIGLLVMTLLFPLILISGLLFVFSESNNPSMGQASEIVNHSDFVENYVFLRLEESYQESFSEDAQASFEWLDQAEIAMIYEIPADFPNRGTTIQIHSINGENNDVFLEAAIQTALSEALLDSTLEEVGINFEPVEVAEPTIHQNYAPIDGQLVLTIFMVIFFMSYSCGIIAGDLNKLRGDGVLTRSIVTNARSWQILGSVLAAYSLYSFLSSILIITVISTIFGITITQIPLILSAILAFCIFNVGFTMLLFRILKNEQIILMIGIVSIVVLVFMGIGIIEMGGFSFIQYLSPFYWLFEALDTGLIMRNIPIIALYGLVLFTAGSFKVERLVRS